MDYDWKSDLAKLHRAYTIAESNGDYVRCDEIVQEIMQIQEIINQKTRV